MSKQYRPIRISKDDRFNFTITLECIDKPWFLARWLGAKTTKTERKFFGFADWMELPNFWDVDPWLRNYLYHLAIKHLSKEEYMRNDNNSILPDPK